MSFSNSNLDKVVVGKVISKEQHPEADRLSVCSVDIGEENLRILFVEPPILDPEIGFL